MTDYEQTSLTNNVDSSTTPTKNVSLMQKNEKHIRRDETTSSSKRRIIKNLFVFSVSYLLQFSASNGLCNLQSSLNPENNVGVITLSISSYTFLATCMFLPIILIKFLGIKRALISVQSCVLLFVMANAYPKYWLMYPAGVFHGVACSCLWAYFGYYVSQLAQEYSIISKRTHEQVLMKFFSIFYLIYQPSEMLGNVTSSFVFNAIEGKSNSNNASHIVEKRAAFDADTLSNVSRLQACGLNDKSHDVANNVQVIEQIAVDSSKVYILCLSYFAYSLLGILIVIIFFANDDDKTSDQADESVVEKIRQTFKIFCYGRSWLFLPISVYSPIFTVFLMVEFSKSFLGCPYGIESIGIWFMLRGFSCTLFPPLISWISKYVDTFYCLVLSLCIPLTFLTYLMFDAQSENQHKLIIFSAAVLLGCCEITMLTYKNTTIGLMFKENREGAYSQNNFCVTLFHSICLTLSSSISDLGVKLSILITFTVYTTVSTILFEVLVNKKLKKQEDITKAYILASSGVA